MSLYSDLNEVLTPYAQRIKRLAAANDEVKADLVDNVNDLKSALMLEEKGSIEVTEASIIQGSFSASGATTSISSRIRVAGFIPVYNGLKIRFTAGTNAQQMLYGKFDASHTYVADSAWFNSGVIDVDWDGYAILIYRKTNNTDITPSEYDATTTLLSVERNNVDNIASDIDNINCNLSAVVYGTNKTFTVEKTGYYNIPCVLIDGSTYTYTNNTGAATNLLLLKSDGTTTVVSTQVVTGASASFVVDGNDYVAIRFYANGIGSVSIEGGYSLTNARDEIDEMTVINGIELHPGYINASGGITAYSDAQPTAYTDKIPCDTGFDFSLSLTYTSADTMWVAYAIYDGSGIFIERPTLDAGVNRLSNTYSVTISNVNAKYIAFTFRTHGNCISAIKSPQYTSIIDIKMGDIDDRLSAVENETQISATAVRSINHRGYNTIAPENTLPAYKLSRKMGFDTVETDVAFTSDGVAVLLHDGTINRTARNADGTEIAQSVDIGTITYEQALQYDFGIWKSAEYAGTKIPTFSQFIQLCKRIGLSAYVELKPTGATEARVRGLVDTVKNCGMTDYVTWISFYPSLLTYVKNYDSTARIGLVTETVNAETIQTANGLKTADNEVFINSDVYGSSVVALCASENIPLEVWTIDNQTTMENLDAYITGATSNSLIFGRVLYNKYIN